MEKILARYINKLHKEFGLTPVVGCELEFYTNCPHAALSKVTGLEIVAEDGKNQAEIRFSHTTDVFALIKQVEQARKKILKVAAEKSTIRKKIWATFTAKPFADQPGSSMQIHLNFLHNGQLEQGRLPKYLEHAIAGLLRLMNDSMPLFASEPKACERFEPNSMTTPTTVSWGYNNRTAALRIVANSQSIRRIEHRVPCADSKVLETFAAVLLAAYAGIKKQMQPAWPEVYGLAFRGEYGLPRLMIQSAPEHAAKLS